jgi:hypothetical protein
MEVRVALAGGTGALWSVDEALLLVTATAASNAAACCCRTTPSANMPIRWVRILSFARDVSLGQLSPLQNVSSV